MFYFYNFSNFLWILSEKVACFNGLHTHKISQADPINLPTYMVIILPEARVAKTLQCIL